MGFYWTTYIVKGSMEPNENFKEIKELSNGLCMYYSHIYKLPTIDPIIDKNEKRLGYINLEEFKRFLGSSNQDIKKSLEPLDNYDNFYFCEIESNTYGPDVKITILPVKDPEIF